jgi:DNA (cytosine-5)-methyltransferase 1
MTVVGQVEIDPFCRRVLARHWPEVPRHDDVRTCVQWWRSEPRPAVHIIAGGYPCTPFSSAGRQFGMADERWGWPWFYDVVRALRPGYVLVENVAALLADRDAFDRMLSDLASSGYDAEWDCIPAAAVGAPHRRDRLFLVAYTDRPARRRAPRNAFGRTRVSSVRRRAPQSRRCRGALAYANGLGRPEQQRLSSPSGRHGEPDADGRGPRIHGRRPEASGDCWAAEPDVGRVAYGVPARVDRLRGLGNAVVPQVAEHVGRLVVAADRERVAS